MRELIWGGGFSVLVLGAFLLFVAFGWPGDVNNCVISPDGTENTCYCEKFDVADIGKPGVRQPFNTWSNLYSLVSGLVLGLVIWSRRKNGLATTDNRMNSTHFYPITYLLLVIFLGLGSMWFHASIVEWAGWFDQFSMFTFASFLVWYTVVRMTQLDWLFYVFYPITVVLLSILGIVGVPSFVLILVAVVAYVVLQVIVWASFKDVRVTDGMSIFLWVMAALSMGAAVGVWVPSQTGGPLCLDTHWFQFHGLWHLLAGVMALFLYFYWIRAPR